MKLGGSILTPHATPRAWGEALAASRFAAVTCPFTHETPEADQHAYMAEAARLGVQVAEVGVWRNTIAPDPAERAAAMAHAKAQLRLADRHGIPCCVNIVGAAGPRWDGAYPANYSADTYALIVQSIREIIDDVAPTRTHYCIEPMPWMPPDGPDSYLRLIQAVDRPRLGVHMDFVNMINSAPRFLRAADFIDECFDKLGGRILSVHIKDIVLEPPLTTVLREVPPGEGSLDYARVLRAIARLRPDMPVLLEHMDSDAQFARAYDSVAGVAAREGIAVR